MRSTASCPPDMKTSRPWAPSGPAFGRLAHASCRRLAALAASAALLCVAPAAAACASGTYSYGGACAPCPAGASYVAATGTCQPAAGAPGAPPSDTAFYLSGAQAEGVAAFPGALPAVTYSTGVFGAAGGGALVLPGSVSGGNLTVPGGSAPSSLPTGPNASWTASAWVKCAAPATWASVVGWGASGDAQGGLSPRAAVLAVVSAQARYVTSLAVSTVAFAGGVCGYLDASGTTAQFCYPAAVAIDSAGNLFVADTGNSRIRKISLNGDVSTVAGNVPDQWPNSNYFRDGTGTNALFYSPTDIALGPSGNLYVSDLGNQRIRLVTQSGVVTTLLNNIQAPALAVSSSGTVYFIKSYAPGYDCSQIWALYAEGGASIVAGINGRRYIDGVGTTAAFNLPKQLALDSLGNLFIADTGNNVIRKMTLPGAVVSTVAGITQSGYADGIGSNARFASPMGIGVDAVGNVFVADAGNNVIRKVYRTGLVVTVAGLPGLNVYTGTGQGDGIGASGYLFRGADTSSSGFKLTVSGDGSVFFFEGSSARVGRPILALPVCDETWHHTALTYASSSTFNILSAYVDGILAAQVSDTAPLTTLPTNPSLSILRIGWGGNATVNSGSMFNGTLADVRIYSRQLTSGEIVSLAQPSASSFSALSISPMSPPFLGASSYLFSCAAGTSGAPSSLAKLSVDNSWSWMPSSPTCTRCAAGSWSAAGFSACVLCAPGTFSLAGASACTPCPAGTYGGASGLNSSTCSGTCASSVTCPTGTAYPPPASALSCASTGARAAPSSLGLLLWPAAHPANAQQVDLVVAPLAACQQLTSPSACAAAATIAGADGVTRYVIGTAAALHFVPAESLACSAQ